MNNISVITLPTSRESNFFSEQVMECYVENNMRLPSSFIFANKKAVNKNEERFIDFYKHHLGNQSPIVAARIVPHLGTKVPTMISSNVNSLDLSEFDNLKSSPLKLERNSGFLVYSISVQPIAETFNQEELKNVWRVLGEISEIDDEISKAVFNRKIKTNRSDYPVFYISYEQKK